MIILRSNFSVLSGLTVEDGYNWDKGLPKTLKPLESINNYVSGSAPFTRVRYRILTDVIPRYRLQTLLTFNCDDYYTETNNITAFNPREPFHPFEDKYGAVWSWAGLATTSSQIRRTLSHYFSAAEEAIKVFDSLDNDQDIFEYPETVVNVLSVVPVKGAHNLIPSLSSTFLQPSPQNVLQYTDGSIAGTKAYNRPVFYERWSQTFNTPPNLLATVETLKATAPSQIPSFNRHLYLQSNDPTAYLQRNPETIDTFSACATSIKIIFDNVNHIDNTAKSLDIAQSKWNLNRTQFNSTNLFQVIGQTPISPISLAPVRDLHVNSIPLGIYRNTLNQPSRLTTRVVEPAAPLDPSFWSFSGVTARNYAAFSPNSTASLSSRDASMIFMTNPLEKSFFSISQNANTSFSQNQDLIASIFVKPIGKITKVRINLGGSCFGPIPCFTDWDLESKILLKKTNNIDHYQIQAVGDGWYYIAMRTKTYFAGSCTYSFVLLSENDYTLNTDLSSSFVFYKNSSIDGKYILIWEPQLYAAGAGYTFVSNDNNKGKVHRISWYFVPHETNYHSFTLGSNSDAVMLYCEENKENDLQNYPFDYLLCRNYPSFGNQIYPESKKHWNQSSIQTKTVLLEKNKAYYFEVRWWQQHVQSFVDVGWGSTNPGWKKYTWTETVVSDEYPKLWLREGYSADAEIEHIYTVPQTYFPVLSVKVFADLEGNYIYDDEDAAYEAVKVEEIRPTANFAVLSTDYGFSPLTVEFSPRNTKPGSFPIERIDWDFGDGTPLITVSRYTTLTGDPNVIYVPNPTVKDVKDPRNYNVRHTFVRATIQDPRTFYPSITAYSAVTDVHSSCSREVGPVSLKGKPQKDIIKTNFYGVQNDATFVFDLQGQAAILRKDNKYKKELATLAPIQLNEPPNRIVYENDLGTNVATNSGLGFKELIRF